jgi:hypothetical protein
VIKSGGRATNPAVRRYVSNVRLFELRRKLMNAVLVRVAFEPHYEDFTRRGG